MPQTIECQAKESMLERHNRKCRGCSSKFRETINNHVGIIAVSVLAHSLSYLAGLHPKHQLSAVVEHLDVAADLGRLRGQCDHNVTRLVALGRGDDDQQLLAGGSAHAAQCTTLTPAWNSEPYMGTWSSASHVSSGAGGVALPAAAAAHGATPRDATQVLLSGTPAVWRSSAAHGGQPGGEVGACVKWTALP